MKRQTLVRFPAVGGRPLAPGDVVRLKNGKTLLVRSLRLMVTDLGTRWSAIDANGTAWEPASMAEILTPKEERR